jgi:hypothetical protein
MSEQIFTAGKSERFLSLFSGLNAVFRLKYTIGVAYWSRRGAMLARFV